MFINEPYNFKSLTKVEIFKNGNLFYACNENKNFSLPIGNYEIKGKIKLIGIYNYKMNLPKFDKLELKQHFVDYGKNNNCASVWDNGYILIDEKFKQISVLEILLLLHEIGHSFFNTELKCDLFAIEILKNVGFNNSQIISAFETIGHTERKKDILKRLRK